MTLFLPAWNKLFPAFIAASLLFGGCSYEDDESYAQVNVDEKVEPAELMIQSSDSLMFNPLQAAHRTIQWPADMNDSLVVAYTFVEPVSSPESIGSLSEGSIIHLSLDENLLVTARVNRNQSIGSNTRSVTATIQGPNQGDVSLSVDKERITGTVNLYGNNRLFYIRYDQRSNRHYIAEINRDNLDIQQSSPPLEAN